VLQKRPEKKFCKLEKILISRDSPQKMMAIAKSRNLSYRVMRNTNVIVSSRNYHANENVVSIGTDQDRNSDTFQVGVLNMNLFLIKFTID
jgi:hypothetical protein